MGLPERSATAVAAVVSVAAVLAVQLILFPVPLGVWIQGAVLGLLGSLMAVGLGLTYRLNKVINFAQGDLGTAPAVLAVGLVAFSGVNYFVGLATGLVASVLLTAIAEFLVVRRFRRSPRLILTVATIGLSQLLVVLSLLIPRIWGQTPDRQRGGDVPLAPRLAHRADRLRRQRPGGGHRLAWPAWPPCRSGSPAATSASRCRRRATAVTAPPCSASRSGASSRSPGWWRASCPS